MLIHNLFRKDLILTCTDDHQQWRDYDWTYLQHMKRFVKAQILEQIPNPQGRRFFVQRPIILSKNLATMMAIWELGGILVIFDLHANILSDPEYSDFVSHIDHCLLDWGDIEHLQIDQRLQAVGRDRLLEIKYWDQDPRFGHIESDPVLATDDMLALCVNSSGTLNAPMQLYYTHQQVVANARANQEFFNFESQEHVMHYKHFMHGGLCVNYLIPSLMSCQHHYFKIDPLSYVEVENYTKDILQRFPITRMLFLQEVSEKLIDVINEHAQQPVTLTSTHWIYQKKLIDKLFDHGRVKRFISMFGCRELLAPFLLHDFTADSWQAIRDEYNPMIFTRTPGRFWQLETQNGLIAVRCSYMQDWYLPGDQFEQLDPTHWLWTGRASQIKRNGLLVVPQVVDNLLRNHFPELKPLVVADYQHKKLYACVYPSTKNHDVLLDEFNALIAQHIDANHQVDTVLMLNRDSITGGGKDPSTNLLKFQARKQLGLDPRL